MYCGAECQKEAWREHKRVCGQLAEKYAAERSGSARERLDQGQYEGSRRHFEKAVQVQRAQQGSGGGGGGGVGFLGVEHGSCLA